MEQVMDAGRSMDDRLEPAAPQDRVQAVAARVTWPQRGLFLLFVLTAFVLFAATVLLPVLRDHTELLEEERALQARIAQLEDCVARAVDFAANMADDPVTNERLARIELGYTRPGETVVRVPPAIEPGTANRPRPVRPRSGALLPRGWPWWTYTAENWANQRGLIEPFLKPSLRAMWLLMSAGLLVAAFVLFTPRAIGRLNAVGGTSQSLNAATS